MSEGNGEHRLMNDRISSLEEKVGEQRVETRDLIHGAIDEIKEHVDKQIVPLRDALQRTREETKESKGRLATIWTAFIASLGALGTSLWTHLK